jgi:hypothetical protein
MLGLATRKRLALMGRNHQEELILGEYAAMTRKSETDPDVGGTGRSR